MTEPPPQTEEAKAVPESPSRLRQMLKTVSKVFSSPSKKDGQKSTAKRTAADREADEDGDDETDHGTDAEVSAVTAEASPTHNAALNGIPCPDDSGGSPDQVQDVAASLITSAIPSPAASPARRQTAKRAKRDSWIPATLLSWTNADDEDKEAARPARRDSSFVSAIFSPVLSLFHSPDEDMQARAEYTEDFAGAHSYTDAAGTQQPELISGTSAMATGDTHATGHARAPSRSSSAARERPLPIAAPADLRAANRPEYHDIDHLVGLSPDIVSFLQCPPRYCTPPKQQQLLPRSPQQDRMTLVLDLDETLVHSMTTQVDDADLAFDINSDVGCIRVFTRIRPHAMDFLRRVSKRYEVVLFTASMQIYANALVDRLDPGNQFFHHRLFRKHCDYQFGIYLKNLGRLGRDLKRTMLVDNSPQVFAYQLSNGIPIVTWSHDRGDQCLADLATYLEDLADLNPEDVRPHVRQRFRLHEQLGRTFSPLGEGDARCPSPPGFQFFAPYPVQERLAYGDEELGGPVAAPASPFARRATPHHALPRRSRASDSPAPPAQEQPHEQQQQQQQHRRHQLSNCENGAHNSSTSHSSSSNTSRRMGSPAQPRANGNGGRVLSSPARHNGSAFSHVTSRPAARAQTEDDSTAKGTAPTATAPTATAAPGTVSVCHANDGGPKKEDGAPTPGLYRPMSRDAFVVKVNSPPGSPQQTSEEDLMLQSPRRSLRVKRQARTRRNSYRSHPDTPIDTATTTRRRLSRPTAYEAQS